MFLIIIALLLYYAYNHNLCNLGKDLKKKKKRDLIWLLINFPKFNVLNIYFYKAKDESQTKKWA